MARMVNNILVAYSTKIKEGKFLYRSVGLSGMRCIISFVWHTFKIEQTSDHSFAIDHPSAVITSYCWKLHVFFRFPPSTSMLLFNS